MSKVKVDEDLIPFTWFIGFLMGILLCLIVVMLVDNISGLSIEKDDKINISGHKYRVINISNIDEVDDTITSVIKIDVNKLK